MSGTDVGSLTKCVFSLKSSWVFVASCPLVDLYQSGGYLVFYAENTSFYELFCFRLLPLINSRKKTLGLLLSAFREIGQSEPSHDHVTFHERFDWLLFLSSSSVKTGTLLVIAENFHATFRFYGRFPTIVFAIGLTSSKWFTSGAATLIGSD